MYMVQQEKSVGRLVIAAVTKEEGRQAIVDSTIKASWLGKGVAMLLRSLLAKMLEAEGVVTEWINQRKANSSSGVAKGDKKNLCDALVIWVGQLSKIHSTNKADALLDIIQATFDKYTTKEVVETISTLQLEEATTLDLGLGFETAEVTIGEYLLSDLSTQATDIVGTDVNKAMVTMLTPDKDGLLHGTFGSCNVKSKPAANQLQYIETNVEEERKPLFVLAGVALEALQLAPRRKTVTGDMLSITSRPAFGNVTGFKSALVKIGAFLVNNLGIHNKRFAGHVSPAFAESLFTSLGIDRDDLVHPSNLQSKHGWVWEYSEYIPNSYTTTSDEDLLTMLL